METFMGFILLAGIVGIYFLWQKFTGAVGGAVGKKINQTVTPKSYKAGRALVAETHHFRVKSTPAEVRKAILAGITAKDSAPAVKGGLYLVKNTSGVLVYDFGNKVQTWFRFVVTFDPSGEETQGIYTFTNWLESDGMVSAWKAMQQLNADTESALRRIDPGASISVTTN